jgi:hypothetical protein
MHESMRAESVLPETFPQQKKIVLGKQKPSSSQSRQWQHSSVHHRSTRHQMGLQCTQIESIFTYNIIAALAHGKLDDRYNK